MGMLFEHVTPDLITDITKILGCVRITQKGLEGHAVNRVKHAVKHSECRYMVVGIVPSAQKGHPCRCNRIFPTS